MREATKQDLPRGAEAQCPICWKLFGSDSSCELHKPYRNPITIECKDPISVGLNLRDRRGLAVWVRSAPEQGKFPKRVDNLVSGEPREDSWNLVPGQPAADPSPGAGDHSP